MSLHRLSEERLFVLVRELVQNVREGIVILQGDLAAGKTTLVKAVVKAKGIADIVTSPTFSLQQSYGDKIFHYDLYNHGLEHFISLGMLEELDKEGLHFVEWGDDSLIEILNSAGMPSTLIKIKKVSDTEREYEVEYAHA